MSIRSIVTETDKTVDLFARTITCENLIADSFTESTDFDRTLAARISTDIPSVVVPSLNIRCV